MIEVEQVKGYYVIAAVDDKRSDRVKGPYSDRGIAAKNCENAGCWGDKGVVSDAVGFFQTKDRRLFEIKKPIKFVDEEEAFNEKVLDEIKSKLSQDEWEFLNLMTHLK